jgi:hypothetical protein
MALPGIEGNNPSPRFRQQSKGLERGKLAATGLSQAEGLGPESAKFNE